MNRMTSLQMMQHDDHVQWEKKTWRATAKSIEETNSAQQPSVEPESDPGFDTDDYDYDFPGISEIIQRKGSGNSSRKGKGKGNRSRSRSPSPSQGTVVQQTESGILDLTEFLVQSAPSQGADAPFPPEEMRRRIAARLAQSRISGNENSFDEFLSYYPECEECRTSDSDANDVPPLTVCRPKAKASQPRGPPDATPAPQPKKVRTWYIDANEQKASPVYYPETLVALTPEEKAALPELCGDADQGGKDYGAAAQQDESQSIFSQGAVVQQNEPREGETIVDMRKRLQKDIGMELFGDLSSDESQEGCVFIACWRFGL